MWLRTIPTACRFLQGSLAHSPPSPSLPTAPAHQPGLHGWNCNPEHSYVRLSAYRPARTNVTVYRTTCQGTPMTLPHLLWMKARNSADTDFTAQANLPYGCCSTVTRLNRELADVENPVIWCRYGARDTKPKDLICACISTPFFVTSPNCGMHVMDVGAAPNLGHLRSPSD